MARPPLHRYRTTVTLTIDYGAASYVHALVRRGELWTALAPRLGRLVGARRVGACRLVGLDIARPQLAPATDAVDPEPLLERLTATREDLAP